MSCRIECAVAARCAARPRGRRVWSQNEGKIELSPAACRYNPCMRQALLLYNPTAGRLPIRLFIGGIIRPLRSAGWRIEVVETFSGRDATRISHQAAAEKYDAVFAIGGDGTAGQ